MYGGEDLLTELYCKAAELMQELKDEETMRVSEKSWDWTNAFEEQGAQRDVASVHVRRDGRGGVAGGRAVVNRPHRP